MPRKSRFPRGGISGLLEEVSSTEHYPLQEKTSTTSSCCWITIIIATSKPCSHISDRPINLSGFPCCQNYSVNFVNAVQIVCRQCALSAAFPPQSQGSPGKGLYPTLGSPRFTLAKPISFLRNTIMGQKPCGRKGEKAFTKMRILTIKCQDRTGFR